jgi:Ca2+-binding EF-hand superfamily protein
MKYSGIELSKETVNFLEDCFMKYQSENTTIIKPREMMKTFRKHNIDKTNPSIFSMMNWIADANEFSGTEGMTFDEIVQYAAYFFS